MSARVDASIAAADDTRSLRDALGSYATGVAIVTTADAEDRPVGLTVNSFTSVSLLPPLVLWCLRRKATSFAAFGAAQYYAVNILEVAQQQLARRFAEPHRDRFDTVTWHRGHNGMPILADTLAFLVCRIRHRWPAGDHVALVGEVIRYQARPGTPLIFHSSHYR